MTIADAARAVGYGYLATRSALRALGFAMPPRKSEERARLRRRVYAEYMKPTTATALAQRHNLTKYTVYAMVQETRRLIAAGLEQEP
jgi:hypothetical protein